MKAMEAGEATTLVHDRGREKLSLPETFWGERLTNIGTGVLRY